MVRRLGLRGSVLVAGLGCAAAAASGVRAGDADGSNCAQYGGAPTNIGAIEAEAERATQGYVCLSPVEATGTTATRIGPTTWLGSYGSDPEKNTFGQVDGYGPRAARDR